MPRATRIVTVIVTSSPSRPMAAVTATLVHAARLICRSAASWAFATFTPPVKYSPSTWPDSSCHWITVIGSLVIEMPADTASSTSVTSFWNAVLTCLLKMARLPGVQHVVRVDHVGLPGGGHRRERRAVGLALPVRGQHPGQQRVLLRQRLAGRNRRDQPQGLAGRGGVGQAVGLIEEQPGLVQDAPAVVLQRGQRAEGAVLHPLAQRLHRAEPRDDRCDALRLGGGLAALGARRVHRGQEGRLVAVGGLDRRLVRRQVRLGGLEQVDHRGGPLVLHEPDEVGGGQRGRVDQVRGAVQVDGVVDGCARHVGEQPDHGDQRDRHEEVDSEPDGPATRSHDTPTLKGVDKALACADPPIAASYGQDGQNSP